MSLLHVKSGMMQQHQCQSETLTDSDQPSCCQVVHVMLSGGVEYWNPKAVSVAREVANQFRC